MQNFIRWIHDNCDWVFSGIGVQALVLLGTVSAFAIRWSVKKKNKSVVGKEERIVEDNSANYEKFYGDRNITGNNNIINIYSEQKEDENKKEKTLFSLRFAMVQKLLNDSRIYNEKEYTLEYISSLIGLKNAGELSKYVENNEEPDEEIKERFVTVFCVNRDWMLFNQGNYPFATNLKKYTNGADIFDNRPMDILRNEILSEVEKFILVIGRYEGRRSVLIIRKTSDYCYELYPNVYDLDPMVGATGKSKLVSFYRFLREAKRIGKIHGVVYKATDAQFQDLYKGAVAPMTARKYHTFKCFTEEFLDLSNTGFERSKKFWDEDLVRVKRIIQQEIKETDYINQETDSKIIQQNLEKKSHTEHDKIIIVTNKEDEKRIEEYVGICTEIVKQPNKIFHNPFVDRLIEAQIDLYKLNNVNLNKITNVFCKEIQEKLVAFDTESKNSLWNVAERIKKYLEDGGIESGELIDEVEFEVREHIYNEIEQYQKENVIEIDVVKAHISDVYACVYGNSC